MIKIAICDDEFFFRDSIKGTIIDLFKKENISFEIDCYSSGEELLNYLKKDCYSYDILFLDILMKGISGIDTAKEIRTFDKKMQIIFLTSTTEHILDGYEVEALNYIIKGKNANEKIKLALNRALLKLKDNKKEFLVINNSNFVKVINLNDIEFIEINNRVLTVHTNLEEINFIGKINDVEKQLENKNFILTHRSYLVNIAKIREITSATVHVESGKKILLSRARSNDVKKAYFKYLCQDESN
ncbi:two-component system response regulator RgbR [Clostridium carnis]